MIGPSQVKDIYYKYFSKLDEHGLGSYISLWQKEGLESESIWEGVMNCTILRAVSYTHLDVYKRQEYRSTG